MQCWKKYCAIYVNNAPTSRLFERRRRSRVSCKGRIAAQRLAWVQCSAAQSERRYDDGLMMLRFEDWFILTGRYCVSHCGHNDFQIFIPEWCIRVILIAFANYNFLACLGSQLVCSLQRSGEMHIVKETLFRVFYGSRILRICRAWPSAACGSRMGKDLLVTQSCVLYPVSSINWWGFVHIMRHFSYGLLQLIQPLMLIMLLMLRETSHCKIISIVHFPSARLTTHVFV